MSHERYEFGSGTYYEGSVVDGYFEGVGKYYFEKGDVYQGNFVKDTFHGVGEYRYVTGSVYEGEFADDLFHGMGTFTFSDGSCERGKFHKDKRVGKFIRRDADLYHEVLYENDALVRIEVVDAGTIHENRKPIVHKSFTGQQNSKTTRQKDNEALETCVMEK